MFLSFADKPKQLSMRLAFFFPPSIRITRHKLHLSALRFWAQQPPAFSSICWAWALILLGLSLAADLALSWASASWAHPAGASWDQQRSGALRQSLGMGCRVTTKGTQWQETYNKSIFLSDNNGCLKTTQMPSCVFESGLAMAANISFVNFVKMKSFWY